MTIIIYEGRALIDTDTLSAGEYQIVHDFRLSVLQITVPLVIGVRVFRFATRGYQPWPPVLVLKPGCPNTHRLRPVPHVINSPRKVNTACPGLVQRAGVGGVGNPELVVQGEGNHTGLLVEHRTEYPGIVRAYNLLPAGTRGEVPNAQQKGNQGNKDVAGSHVRK